MTFKCLHSAFEVCCDSTGNTFPIVGEDNLVQVFFFFFYCFEVIASSSKLIRRSGERHQAQGRIEQDEKYEYFTETRFQIQTLNLAGGRRVGLCLDTVVCSWVDFVFYDPQVVEHN